MRIKLIRAMHKFWSGKEALVEEDGYDWGGGGGGGGTVGGKQVHYNRDPLKGNHSGGHVPLVPPGSATYGKAQGVVTAICPVLPSAMAILWTF